uniref:Elongator complex protein 2 n=1 Tax=Strongyloides papillosus TaxID=174720 RepID=A0A0N5CI81_STREA
LSNSKIAILTKDEKSGNFIDKLTLEGHLDWIRDLSFNKFEDQLLLASASQDTFVRIWSFKSIDNNEMDTEKGENNLKIKEVVFESHNNS